MLLTSLGSEVIDSELVKLLNAHGIRTVTDFLNEQDEKLLGIDEFSTISVKRCKRKIVDAINPRNQNVKFGASLSTGSDCLDAVLGGGLLDGKIIEIFGASGSGKSQLAMALAANCCIQGRPVHYIDTNNDFSPEQMRRTVMGKLRWTSTAQSESKRVKRSPSDQNHVANEVLDHCKVLKTFILEDLIDQLYGLGTTLSGLLILDNLASLVMPLLGSSDGGLSEVSGYLSLLREYMRRISHRNGLSVIVINNAYVKPETVKPFLGKFMHNFADMRLLIERTSTSQIMIQTLNDEEQAQKKVGLSFNECGLMDCFN